MYPNISFEDFRFFGCLLLISIKLLVVFSGFNAIKRIIQILSFGVKCWVFNHSLVAFIPFNALLEAIYTLDKIALLSGLLLLFPADLSLTLLDCFGWLVLLAIRFTCCEQMLSS